MNNMQKQPVVVENKELIEQVTDKLAETLYMQIEWERKNRKKNLKKI